MSREDNCPNESAWARTLMSYTSGYSLFLYLFDGVAHSVFRRPPKNLRKIFHRTRTGLCRRARKCMQIFPSAENGVNAALNFHLENSECGRVEPLFAPGWFMITIWDLVPELYHVFSVSFTPSFTISLSPSLSLGWLSWWAVTGLKRIRRIPRKTPIIWSRR